MKKAQKKGSLKTVFKIYLSELKNYPGLLSLVLIGILGIQLADIVFPLYLRQFFNLVAANNPTDEVISSLLTILGSILIVSLISWACRRLHSFSIQYLEAKIMANLLSGAFENLLGHSHQFFINQFAGTLTRRVSRFSHAFETMFDGIVMQFMPTMLFIFGAVGVLYIRNQALGLIMAGWVMFFIIFQIFVTRLRQPLRIARAEEDSKVIGMLSDSISNQNTIALFSGVKYELKRFGDSVAKWRDATIRSWNADEYIWSAQGLFLISINVGLLYGALIFWRKGSLMVGDFVLIQSYLLGTFERLIGINREFRRFYDAFADAREMAEILETPHEIQNITGAKDIEITNGKIYFNNISFYFNKQKEILENFNLEIRGKEKVALVGPSGSGKSTVTKLLLRFYNVVSGQIEIDGQDISKVTQESLRRSISFVPQEPLLFHRSLLENIRYGKMDASDEEVIDAAKKAHCHEFISTLPDGYSTFVGERGIKLSGGERQRVAIARAILKNSHILVLDEATSSLDSESESLIQDALETLMKDKTVVVIAHRLSTIMKMDRIIVLDCGKITSEGKHNQLISTEGLYKKLWSIQAGGFLSDGRGEQENIIDESEEEEEKETSLSYN